MKHPIDDPKLASYQCPEYNRRMKYWELLSDVYNGDLNEVVEPRRYLPQETSEPNSAYQSRLIRSPFDNHLAPTVRGFAGALCNVQYDSPEQVQELDQDIDLQGNSTSVFVDAVDKAALRDSYTFILVDYYVDDQIRRPFLRAIDVRQILNWTEERGQILKATIAEETCIPMGYGYETELLYRVIVKDSWKLIRVVELANKSWGEEIISEGDFLGVDGQPLGVCPLFPYSITTAGWSMTEPPMFFGLAKLNVRLYQSQSDCWEIIHKCNCPVPCVAVGAGANLVDSMGNLSLGANDFLDLGLDGKAFYLQPSGDSITNAVESIDRILASIKSFDLMASLNVAHQGKTRTATEIRMAFSSTQKQISRLAEQKKSALTSLLWIIGAYLRIDPESMGEVEVNADISALLTDEATIPALYQAGLLSLEAAVQRLHQLGFSHDAGAELLLLSSQQLNETAHLMDKIMESDTKAVNPPLEAN